LNSSSYISFFYNYTYIWHQANIPVVIVSLNSSLSPLSDDGILLLGSGYTFHNTDAFFNPTPQIQNASFDFNHWLKHAILSPVGGARAGATTKANTDTSSPNVNEAVQSSLDHSFQNWDKAPGARLSHPREDHLLPLFVVASAAASSTTTPYHPQVIYESDEGLGGFLITAYRFA
jgi:aromatic ring-opening dioxygenase catalytic subunit (LigB family)